MKSLYPIFSRAKSAANAHHSESVATYPTENLRSYWSSFRKVAILLLFLITSVSNVYSQYCLTATTNELITPGATSQTTAVYNNGVRAFRFDATVGCTYTFSTCGLSSADTYLRLYSTGTGGTALVSADDNCGAQSSFTWTCATAGTYSVLLTNYSCAALSANTSMSYSRSCPTPTCSHSIELTDTYGDGWNGGSVSVAVNGVTVLSNITLPSGAGPAAFSFSASTGQSISVSTTANGSWYSEMRYTVKNGSGVALVSNHNPSVSGNWTGTGACAPPCTPPSVVGFGTNTWNVLGYEHAAYNYANLATLTGETFKGYYTDATVDINSQAIWISDGTPSSASGWTGCSVSTDNHTVVYKRQGFPSAFYQIDLNTHDDGVQCYVNGTLVYQIDGCCADRGVIWSGRLCSTSTVEFRVMEGGGGSNLAVDFIESAFTAGTISGTQTICPSGTSALTTSGNTGGTWTTSNAAVATVNSSTGLVTAIGSGSATITYTVNGGACGNASATLPITVVVGASAGVLSGTQTACVGSTTTFTSNGTAGGTWSSDNSGIASVNASTGVVSGVSAGTATITYTVLGSGGCPNATATRTVTVSVTPTSNAGADATLCPSQTTVLNGSSNTSDSYVYTLNMYDSYGDGWNGGYLTAFINGTASGNYSAGGYGTTATINILPGQTLYFTYTSGAWEGENSYTISLNGTAVYTGGPTPATGTVYTNNSHPQTVTYAWTPSTALSSATILTPTCSAATTTTYTLTVTSNGCSSSDQVTITVIPGASAGVLSGTQTACVGAATTFTSNGTAGGTWTSDNSEIASVNASTGVVSGVSAGTATITYTVLGSGGCPNATATRTVTVNASPTANAGADATLCPGQTASLGVALALSTAPVSSSAYGTDNTNFTTSVTVSGAPSGATITSLTFTPSLDYYGTPCNAYISWYVMQYWNGSSWVNLPCGSSVTINDFNGTVANGLVFTMRVIDSDAVGDAVTISINNLVVNYSNPTTYSWSPATNLSSSTVSNPTCSATTTTTYTLTASANGCSSTDQVVVTVLPGVSAGVLSGTQTACVGATTTFTSNGTAGGTWTSDNSGIASVNASTGVISGVSAGTATITYTVLGSGGCPNATATRTVTINAVPSTPTVTVTDNCDGTSTLSTTATGTLLWSNSETTSPITVSTADTYTVAQTANGCTSASGSGVAAPKTTPETPSVTVTNDCGLSTLEFTPAENATILWSNNATMASTTTSSNTTLTVVQTVNGCPSSSGSGSAVPLVIPSAPTATAAQSFCVTDNATVASLAYTNVAGNTYTWYDAATDGNTVATSTQLPTATTNYYLSATGSNGCTSTTRTAVAATESEQALATVSITGTSTCPGGEITFTATPSNGGNSPTYQWYNGGVPILNATGNTYIATGLAEGAVITVKMIPSGSCVTVCPN